MSREESGSDGIQCGFSRGLNRLWGLKIPSKIKIHTWRLIFNALPTRSNLLIRKAQVEPYCPRFNTVEENTHLIWYCPFAQPVWKQYSVWPVLFDFHRGSADDLFKWMVEHGSIT